MEFTFDVRPYADVDRDAVLDLAPRLTIGVAAWRDRDAVAAAVRGWVERSTAPDSGDAACVCVAGSRVVGFVSMAETTHFAGERDAYIGELVVDAAFEGLGVGRLLVAAAERWAADAGCRCITLHTGAANDRARRFYAEQGYIEEDVKLTKVLAPAIAD